MLNLWCCSDSRGGSPRCRRPNRRPSVLSIKSSSGWNIFARSKTHTRVAGCGLRERKVAEKSKQITANPDLLDLLTLKGATVTIDAMGCQKEIAEKIKDKQADYVLALKGNQGTLSKDVELFFTEQKARGFADTAAHRHQTLEKSHGRIETRTYTAVDDIAWLQERNHWVGLKSIVMVESIREIGDKIESETRFYISSLAADAE